MKNNKSNLIVKKVKRVNGEEAHGQAWKIAFADFMTAMMALFLVLWLLNITTSEERDQIAAFFNPLSAPSSKGGMHGILGGSSASPKEDGRDIIIDDSTDLQEDGRATSQTPSQGPNDEGNQGELHDDWLPPDVQSAMESELTPEDVLFPLNDILAQEKQAEAEIFEQIMADINQQLLASLDLSEFLDQVIIEIVDEGLRIQITDQDRKSMFAIGSSRINDKGRELLTVIAGSISGIDNEVIISGHTDSIPYSGSSEYTNWNLSTDRANEARRTITSQGVNQNRIAKIEGLADKDHLYPHSPNDPRNRRISITILSKLPNVSL